MDEAWHYETFIRRAFGTHNKSIGEMISRWGDPAELADTDTFSVAGRDPACFAQVKAAAVYAMAIVGHRTEKEGFHRYKQAIDQAILAGDASQDTSALITVIKGFVSNVEFAAFPPQN